MTVPTTKPDEMEVAEGREREQLEGWIPPLATAAEITEAYVSLERSTVPDAARLAATGGMIDRLDGAFTRYAANLQDADLDELDLRSLKQTLQMDVLRCKTPELVRKELWTHILAYNLIRTILAQAASKHGIDPHALLDVLTAS